jgi:tetratricopeptide (TPR) repeat protein
VRTKNDRLLMALGVALLATLPYVNALRNGFTMDDVPLVAENARIRSLAGIARAFSSDWWDGTRPRSLLYRPLAMASFGVDDAVARWSADGPPPARLDDTRALPFHVGNVLWHAAATAALFLLLSELFGSAALAIAAAALFAVHPVHTEAVDGIVGRAELMSACFSFLALLCAWRAVREEAAGLGRPALAGGLLFLALLSKEQAIVIPVIPFLWPSALRRPSFRKLLAGFVVATLAYVALRTAVLGTPFGTAVAPAGSINIDNPIAGAAGLSRVLTPLRVFGHALALLVFPKTLSADYSYDQIPLVNSLDLTTALCALALAGLAAGAFLLRRRAPAASFGIGFFLLSWLVTSNVPLLIGTIFGERLLYLPSAGACLVAASALTAAARRMPVRGAVTAATIVLLAAGGTRTWSRNRDWKDNQTLFASAAATSPRSCKALNAYASELLTAGRPRDALPWAERALAVFPPYPDAHETIAGSLRILANDERDPTRRAELRRQAGLHLTQAIESMRAPADRQALSYAWNARGGLALGEGDAQRAQSDFEKSLALAPRYVPSLIGLGVALMKSGQTEAASKQFERALAEDPGNLEARQNASAALRELASRAGDERARALLLRRADDEESKAMAADRGPTDASSLANLHGVRGQRLLGEKRFADALAEFREAARLEPGATRAYLGIGAALGAEAETEPDAGRKTALVDEAIGSFERALAIEPDDPTAHLNLGITYLRQRRDPAKVAEHFRAYLRLVPDSPQRAQMEETIRRMEATRP